MTCISKQLTTFHSNAHKLQQLAVITSLTDDGVIGVDLDGVITSWNRGAENIYGYTAKEVLGKSVSLIYLKEKAKDLRTMALLMKRGKCVEHFETVGVRKDKATINISISTAPIKNEFGKLIGILGIIRDITAQKHAKMHMQAAENELRHNEEKLHETCRMLQLINEGSQALIYADDENTILQEICDLFIKVGGYKFVWVGYAEQNNHQLVHPKAKAGCDAGYLDDLKISWASNRYGRNPYGIVIHTKKPYVVADTQMANKFKSWSKRAKDADFASMIILPLISDHMVLGTLAICSAKSNDFPQSEQQILDGMAKDLAYGVLSLRRRKELHETKHELEKLLVRTAAAIALTLEKRDPYTTGHQERTAALSYALAKELGLPDNKAEVIRLIATIHDIGKIHIPAEILSHPGVLLPEEMALIRIHPIIGYDIIKSVNFPWPEVSGIVLQHHERLDGSGYPYGLKGDDISLEARIVAVADVVEAMVSHRPYRPAAGVDAALHEISSNKGTLYDEVVVDLCVKLFREKNFTFPTKS